ncbi:phage tail tape measure protein [Longispora albida]|uniref:phage tail tape measure protein n=1 Tax=Longispora albida TaxID=203523 RepID=UPI0012F917D2|nr:phage tail tape measure protein [Longispora albida]
MALNVGELFGTVSIDSSQARKGLDETEGAFEGLLGTLKAGAIAAAAAGIAIGAALVGGLAGAMDTEAANARLTAQLGATGPEAKRYGQAAGALYSAGYGESLAGVSDAIRAATQNGILGRDATVAEIKQVSGGLLTVAEVLGEEVGRTATAVGNILRNGLAKNAKEAFDLITAGAQNGANKADDLVDTFNEYSVQFAKLGLSGPQALGLLSQAIKAGARDSDVAADALKEFAIRAVEGTAESAASFAALGLNADKMRAAVAKGGPAAAAALDEVLDRLRKTQGKADAATVAFGLFGTKSEDLQGALYALDPSSAVAGLGQLTGATDKAGATLHDTAASSLEAFKRQVQTAFVDFVGGKGLPVLKEVTGYLSANFGPSVKLVAGFISGDIIPALSDFYHWVDANKVPLQVVAGIIAAIFLPHLIALGVTATVTGVKTAAAWVMTQVAAIRAAAVHSAQVVAMVARWIFLGAQAIWNAGRLLVAYALMDGGAVRSAATAAVTFARHVAGWVLLAVQSGVQAARSAAAWLVIQAAQAQAAGVASLTFARMVGGWILMGTQSLMQAARMAAAWVVAMGPIGWVIAFVIAVVALIIANWDTVKKATVAAWEAVWGAIKTVWSWIVAAVTWYLNFILSIWRGAWDLLLGVLRWARDLVIGYFRMIFDGASAALGWISSKIDSFVGFVLGLKGRITSAASGLFDGLVSAGRSGLNFLISLWNRLDLGFSIRIPDWVPGIGGQGFSVPDLFPDIPMLAKGGIVPATPGGRLAVVGEGGQDEAVIPLNRLAGMLGAGGGGPVYVTVQIGERAVSDMVEGVLTQRPEAVAAAARTGDRYLNRRG